MTGGYMRGRRQRAGATLRQRRAPAVDNSAAVLERLAALEATVTALAQAQAEGAPALTEAVERLDKQLARAGKEQFKANALAEAQQKSMETARQQLLATATQNERELTQLRERLTTAGDDGRMEVIRRLFPALDGLDEALTSGRRLLQASAARRHGGQPPQPSFWARLTGARPTVEAEDNSQQEAIASWLEGLAFVQERLLAALALDNVTPIHTEGRPFDPHYHQAVEIVPATDQTPPGVIVREHRRGYMRGDTVLRYAEVVVARTTIPPKETSS